MLDDKRFRAVADELKGGLVCLMLVALQSGNRVLYEPLTIAQRIGYQGDSDALLSTLERVGLIEPLPDDSLVPCPRRSRLADSVRARIMVRDGGRCRRCGSTRSLEVDHIVPVSKGGHDYETNLQTLCARCNRRKAAKMKAAL
jgi:hypothetical protein